MDAADGVDGTAVKGEGDGGPEGDIAVAEPIGGLEVGIEGEEGEGEGSALEDHFEFSAPSGGEVFTLLFEEAAESGDEHFPADDDSGHQGGHAGLGGVFDEEDEGSADDDLVGEGIDDASEGADEIVTAGDITIGGIGGGGEEKEDGGSEAE